MKEDFKFIVIVPTHRILFFKQNIKSIINQTIKPDYIIVIDDTDLKETTEIKKITENINFPIFYYNKTNQILIENLNKNGPIRAFSNIFLCLANQMKNESPKTKTFVQILEDDCYYIRKNFIQEFKKLHDKFKGSLYRLNLIENDNDLQKSLAKKFRTDIDYPRSQISYSTELVDTSGFIFEYNEKIINTINDYLKDKNYTLSADMYIFEILFNYFNKNFIDAQSLLVYSTQHSEQVSRNSSNDLLDDSHKWVLDLKKLNIDISAELFQEFLDNLEEIKERYKNSNQFISDESYNNIPSVKFINTNNLKDINGMDW